MKSMLMAIMAVAVAVTFSAPAFAGDEGKKKPTEQGGKYTDTYGEEKDKKKDAPTKYTDTFGDEKKKDEKPVPGK
jgi:hypothetical protein